MSRKGAEKVTPPPAASAHHPVWCEGKDCFRGSRITFAHKSAPIHACFMDPNSSEVKAFSTVVQYVDRLNARLNQGTNGILFHLNYPEFDMEVECFLTPLDTRILARHLDRVAELCEPLTQR